MRRERAELVAQRDRLTAELSARLDQSMESGYADHARTLLAEAAALTTVDGPDELETATGDLVADRLLALRDELLPGWDVIDWLAHVAALAAWAEGVGPSATTPTGRPEPIARLGPAPALGRGARPETDSAAVQILGELLPFGQDPSDLLLGEDDPHERAAALLRDHRIIADLTAGLAATGTEPPDLTAGDLDRAEQWAAHETPSFQRWRADRSLPPIPDDLVEELLTEWAAYTPARLVWACSPHRVVSFAAELSEEWGDPHRVRTAWSLIEPWTDYCLEHAPPPPHLARPVRDAARAITRAPRGIAARAVDTCRTATDETLQGWFSSDGDRR